MSRKWMLWGGCGAVLLVGAYFLWTNGYQNILGYGVFLLCPLMHLFMHRGHNHGGHHGHDTAARATDTEEQKLQNNKPACH